MRFGLVPINVGMTSLEEILGYAHLAEANSFTSVWTYEHIVMPLHYDSWYAGNPKTGKLAESPETNFLDSTAVLSAIAATTTTLRIATGVNVLPQSNPLIVAKQAASLDLLSNGRFTYGVGLGWLKEEFDAMGVPFARRGARFDDYLEAIKKVWSGEVVEHRSEFLDWHGFKSYPVPRERKVPIVIGGYNSKTCGRIARHCDGWYMPGYYARDLRPMVEDLRRACADVGRDLDEIELICMWAPASGTDELKALEELGIRHALIHFKFLEGDRADAIKRLGDEVVSAFS
jgi:probable F420-dependent oxidoreductase